MIEQKQLEAFKIHCQILAKDLADDLFQHVVLIVLEKKYDEEYILPLLKKIAFYQYCNKRSSFSKMFKPKPIEKELFILYQEDSEEFESRLKREKEEDIKLQKVNQIIESYPKDKRELFTKEVFLEAQRLGSYSKLSKKSGINKQTLIKAGKRYVNNLINNHF